MKVEVITGFYDVENKTHRMAGKVYECPEERASKLAKLAFVKMLEKPSKKTAKSKQGK